MAEQFTEDFFMSSDIRYFSDVSDTTSDSDDNEDLQASAEVNEDQQASAEADAANEDEPATSCSCGLPASKQMIGCDSGDCEIEWYHYKCVGFTAKTLPVGDWMCERCHNKAPKSIHIDPDNEDVTPDGEQADSNDPNPEAGTKSLKKNTKASRKIIRCWCGTQLSNTPHSLKRHQQLVHQNQRMYKCKACPKNFTGHAGKKLLRMHFQKCHTIEGILDCIICGKEFLRPSQLRKHHQSHTGEKSHRCDICGKGFPLKWSRRLHKETVHKDAARPGALDVVVISINGQATETHSYAQKDRKVFKCGSCGLLFDKEMDVIIHQVDHQVASLNERDDLS